MPGVITTTQTWADGDQVTSEKLNLIPGGSSFTDDAITGTTLVVDNGKLKVGVITASQLGAESVTSAALGPSSVTAVKIYDGNVIGSKLADSAVYTAKIADGAVTIAKMASSAVATAYAMREELPSYYVSPDAVKYSHRAAKAHCRVALGVGTRTLEGNSVNVSAVSAVSSTVTRVAMTTNFSSTNYTVIATWESSTEATGSAPVVFNRDVGAFSIKHDAAAAGKIINIVCFGVYP